MKQIEKHTHIIKSIVEKNRYVSVLVGFVFSTNTEAITQHTGKSQTKIHKTGRTNTMNRVYRWN